MLSSEQIRQIHQQLDHMPDEKKGKKRANLRRELHRKLKENDYATTYERFKPLPHIPYFINRMTNEKTLRLIVRSALSANEFTMDTESVNVPGEENIPTLIQLQLLLLNHPSVIMIIEMHYLPRGNSVEFSLIKGLFEIVFLPGKSKYIFGSKDELIPFARFELFTIEQVRAMEFIDLQKNFKRFWNEQHSHQRIDRTNDKPLNNCMCESCIGRDPQTPWSLQDCVVYQLNKYLPKIHSRSNFDMGLDPELHQRNSSGREHRKNLTEYALNDCLSMEMLILQMKMKEFNFISSEQIHQTNPREPFELAFLSSDDDNSESDTVIDVRMKTSRIVCITTENGNEKRNVNEQEGNSSKKQKHVEYSNEFDYGKLCAAMELDDSVDSSGEMLIEQPVAEASPPARNIIDQNRQNPLPLAERRKIHNRSRSRHQRIKAYTQEFIIYDIEKKFPVKLMKQMLKQRGIDVTRIHPVPSKRTEETILYVGIRQPISSDKYEEVKDLFNRENYRRLFPDKFKKKHVNQHRFDHRPTRANRHDRQNYRRES